MNEILEKIRRRLGDGQIFADEPMTSHTTFKVGGPADLLVMPYNGDELAFALETCRAGNVPCFVMGNGSNLLVKDGGIRGVVVSLMKMNEIKLVDDDKIEAQAGALMSAVSKFAYENSLAGLEFAEGIPGSVGGGVVMNAGAYGGEIGDVFQSAKVVDENCKIIEIDLAGMEFSYRKSAAQKADWAVVSVVFAPTKGNKVEIAAKMAEMREQRTSKQPLALPSAGSTFKRPPGRFAGKLIMDAGLRGFAIGGAQVSEKHCGFIVNKGGAAAADVLALMEHVQKVVKEKFGICLEAEVKIVGEE